MLQLHFYCSNEKLWSFKADKKVIQIGRAETCDIRLPDPTLSRTHCILSLKGNEWQLEDCSKNGLFLDPGGSLIQRKKIKHKDRFRLGRIYSFEVDLLPAQTVPEKTVLTNQSQTQLLSYDSQKEEFTLGSAQITGQDAEGYGFTKKIEGVCSIGNHESNDIIFPKETVSQFHARIDLIQNEFILTDLNSTNGTFLNGLRIKKVVLIPQAKIQVGPYSLEFSIVTTQVKVEPKETTSFMGMVSQNHKMKKIFSAVETIATTDAPVFICGETGTGKELLARAIHDLSLRSAGSFIALNCAVLTKDLAESELFGHRRGAFTGAVADRAGAFESAHGGTLFLDEIAELDLTIQAKLLRAFETGQFQRLGSSQTAHASVRLISATHKDMPKLVKEGKFREDLFYRVHVVPLELPPLRDRPEDFSLLIPELLKQLKLSFSVKPEVIEVLSNYSFPGNIRELKNILQRAAIECQMIKSKYSGTLFLKHFHFLKDIETAREPRTPKEEKEKVRILELLKECDFVKSEVARKLHIPPSTLHDKIKRYGLSLLKSIDH